jgi:hypothetical protein
MRKSTWRALLILALLVPLSRFSFCDDTFAVSATFSDTGDVESGFITLPSSTIEGGGGVTWGGFNNIWPIGTVAGAVIELNFIDGSGWSFEGITGSQSFGTLDAEAGPFTVGDDGVTGAPAPATWTGELYLENSLGATLFEIQMEGVGTGSVGGNFVPPLGFFLISGYADVTGEGEVVYAAPSVPEPSTLTLMMTALIASILAMRFRRTIAMQN